MKFNVASLLKEHTGATREFDLDEELLLDGGRRRLSGHVRFDRTRDGVLVRAHLSGEAAGECSRCLRPLTFRVPVDLEEEYIPTVDIDSGARVRAPEGEEDAYRIDARHMLDLAPAVREYWGMAVPMAPRCAEDCGGLCPQCGAERGAGHVCAGDDGDPRWAALRGVRL